MQYFLFISQKYAINFVSFFISATPIQNLNEYLNSSEKIDLNTRNLLVSLNRRGDTGKCGQKQSNRYKTKTKRETASYS